MVHCTEYINLQELGKRWGECDEAFKQKYEGTKYYSSIIEIAET